MTQKSLVYMMLAVAVGYLLVSTVPQQVSMYTTPRQQTLSVNEDGLDVKTFTGADGGSELPEANIESDDKNMYEIQRVIEEPSFLETSRLPELMKWWTLDIVVALSIYWVARRRLV